MKKLFKNFSWQRFIVFSVVFILVSIPLEWFFGVFDEAGFSIKKFIIGLILKGILFGLLMSLLVKKEK